MEGLRALGFHQKYLNLCSEDERRSYGFSTTWGWVINVRIFIFGWSPKGTDSKEWFIHKFGIKNTWHTTWLLKYTTWFYHPVRFINNYPIKFGQKSWCNLRWPADFQRPHCKNCLILQVCIAQHQKDQAHHREPQNHFPERFHSPFLAGGMNFPPLSGMLNPWQFSSDTWKLISSVITWLHLKKKLKKTLLSFRNLSLSN